MRHAAELGSSAPDFAVSGWEFDKSLETSIEGDFEGSSAQAERVEICWMPSRSEYQTAGPLAEEE
jgi:hypothetical protein